MAGSLLKVKRRRNQKSTAQVENALQDAHPGVVANIDKRANCGKLVADEISQDIAKFLVNMKKLFEEYSDACKNLKAAKLRAKQLEQMKMDNQRKGLWLVERPLDELNPEELLALDAETAEFIVKLKKHRQELLAKGASSTSMSAGGSNASPN